MPPRGYKKNGGDASSKAQQAAPHVEATKTVEATAQSSTQASSVVVKTDEQVARKSANRPAVVEKSSDKEKNEGPLLIISWTENGKRHTKQYTCAEFHVNEITSKTFLKSGTKTTIDITIEAQVIEVL